MYGLGSIVEEIGYKYGLEAIEDILNYEEYKIIRMLFVECSTMEEVANKEHITLEKLFKVKENITDKLENEFKLEGK